MEKKFSDSFIEVSDDSHLHADHNPSAKSGDTHFTVKIVSKVFKGKSRLEKHRIVNNILDSEFRNGLHALSLTLSDKE
ncbi:MAG: BolA family transcriptional regulator [Rhodobiaceae bacterium]|nr:BolA family transcriptional regulator [Rhodobiaceae bacterium]